MQGRGRAGRHGRQALPRATAVVTGLAPTLALAIALTGALACSESPAGTPLGSPESDRAARAGIDWMLDHAGELPEGWAWPYLLRLHRVAPDDALANRIAQALREDARRGRHTDVGADLFDAPDALSARELSPILFELEHRKQLGLPYEETAQRIQQRIADDERSFWKPLRATQRGVYLHLFDELGIETDRSLDDLIAGLERNSQRMPAEELARNRHYLYGLTHLVLARARYYRQYPDAEELQFTVPLMRAALRHHLELLPDDEIRDLQGELLSCLQLLRAADDEAARATRRELVQAQNEDGSWGDLNAPASSREKVHLTFNAIVATLAYPDPLRPDPEPPSSSSLEVPGDGAPR